MKKILAESNMQRRLADSRLDKVVGKVLGKERRANPEVTETALKPVKADRLKARQLVPANA